MAEIHSPVRNLGIALVIVGGVTLVGMAAVIVLQINAIVRPVVGLRRP